MSPLPALALLFAFTVPIYAQQGSINANGHVYLYNTDSERQFAESLIRQRREIESLKAQQYDLRNPTAQEVAEMESEWKAKNPFKPTHSMPDFSKRKIRAEKSDDLNRKLAEIEMRLQQLEGGRDQVEQGVNERSQQPRVGAMKQKRPPAVRNMAPQSEKPPPAANPSNVLMRKLSDGRYMVIANGQTRYFTNEAKAKAYLSNVR